MQLTRTARKHRIGIEDIRRVLAAPLRTVQQGDRVLHIGLTPARDLVEVVVARDASGEAVVVHAMRLRPANYVHMVAG